MSNNFNCGLAHPSHHDVISAKRMRGNVEIFWYFVQDCFKINSTSFQFYTIFFQLHQKCPNFTRLLTEGSGVRERLSVNAGKRADQRSLSVCD